MNITHKKAILSALFFGLGLVSCSKETEIKYQKDTFAPSDILVEKTDKSFTALNNLSSMDFSRQLVINDENTAPENLIKNLVLSTTCRGTASATESTYNSSWPNPTTVNILDILPTDILLQRKPEPIYCDISYTVTNSVGSTSVGKAVNVTIQNIDSFSNLSSDHPFANKRVSWVASREASVIPFTDATTIVVCDDFSVTKTNLPTHTTLSQLLEPKDILANSPKSGIQVCRAIFRTKKQVSLSPVFEMQLQTIPLSVDYSYSKRGEYISQMDANQKINVRITNPNTFPVAIKFDARGRVLLFRAVYHLYGSIYVSSQKELGLDWQFNDQSISIDNLNQEYLVPGSSVATLDGSVRGGLKCANLKFHAADNIISKEPHGTFLGYNMGLNMELAFAYKESDASYVDVVSQFLGTITPSQSGLPVWDVSLGWQNGGFKSIEQVAQSVLWAKIIDSDCR